MHNLADMMIKTAIPPDNSHSCLLFYTYGRKDTGRRSNRIRKEG